MNNNVEFRESVEVRAIDSEGKMIIEGVVNNIGEFSKTLGGVFREKILPGVFERAINKATEENRDIFLLHQHDTTSLPLASITSGTLELKEDTETRQLVLRAELPHTTFAKDIYELVKSKVLREFSFGFTKPVSTWKIGGDNVRERTISSIELREISIVKTGAYNGTEVFARALEEIEELREEEDKMKDNESLEINEEESTEKRAYIYDDSDLLNVTLQTINYISSIIRKNKKVATSYLDDSDLENLNNTITTCNNIINKINLSEKEVTSTRAEDEGNIDKSDVNENKDEEIRSIELELKRKRIKL